jgi:hypothetical protein
MEPLLEEDKMKKQRRANRQRKHQGPEPTRTLEPAPPLKIEVTEREILADLIYPARMGDGG